MTRRPSQNKTRERIQAFEGVCIARQGAGLNEAFTVRKLSYGEGVERVFPIYSPLVDSVVVVRKGKVRRAKLYYLRGRTGKARAHQRAHRECRPGSRRLSRQKTLISRAAPEFRRGPFLFGAQKSPNYRAFPRHMQKSPDLLRFFAHQPASHAGNAVKSGASVDSLEGKSQWQPPQKRKSRNRFHPPARWPAGREA